MIFLARTIAAHCIRPAGCARRHLCAVVVEHIRVCVAAGAAVERAAGASAATCAVHAVFVGFAGAANWKLRT